MRGRGRAVVLLLTAFMVLAGACGGGASDGRSPRQYRIGFLSASAEDSYIDALKAGLRAHGYTEGANLTLDIRTTESDADLPGFAQEFVTARVDLIIAGGTRAVEAAKAATTTIPIVMTNSGDPVGGGLVASLEKPGGNVTGLTQISPELAGKRLELLREAAGRVKVVAVLWNDTHSAAKAAQRELVDAASALGVTLRSVPVADKAGMNKAARAITSDVDAAVVIRDPFTIENAGPIAQLLNGKGVPSMFETRNFLDDGGLMLYGPNFEDLYRRSAGYVDKIFEGARPGDLPIERPTKFELIINMKTANALRLSIPQSLLDRADELIR
ncbi:MAG TPA: ABC transporter substrate-binding protein [Microvirga sp.]|nr:ABC transporter substrate-binding protein [Microvirga sp.]